jgi:hypothetical protein
MPVTVGVFNHTPKLFLNQEVNLSAIKALLLDNNASFDATDTTIDQVTNGTSGNAPVTISIASPGVVTWNGHGLSDGDMVLLTTTGALPTGLTAGGVYFVVNSDTNTFQLEATVGGGAINTSGGQSGVHTAFHIGDYEVSGNGWTPGGETLDNVAATTVTTNDANLGSDDEEVIATGGDIGPAYANAFYDALTGKVLKYVDYGQAWTAGETTPFKLRILSGLFNLDYTPA